MSADYLYSISYIATTLNAHYASASIVAFTVYDVFTNLDVEISYLMHLNSGVLKALFVLCRLLPVGLCSIRLAENLISPQNAVELCPIVVTSYDWVSAITIACVEYIFLLRTSILWLDHKIVVIILRISFVVVIITGAVTTGMLGFLPPASYLAPDSTSGLTGCFSVTSGNDVSGIVPFILMLTFELETFCLTLYKSLKHLGAYRGRVVTLLMRHSILYFTAALILVVPVIVTGLVGYSQAPVFSLLQVVGQSMVVTRMQVHLRDVNKPQADEQSFLTTPRFAPRGDSIATINNEGDPAQATDVDIV